ncbi:MAG: CBS domain-containing protein [Dongiaceae bacterium]
MLPIARTIVPDVISEQRLVTLSARDMASTAIELMAKKRIGAVPVVERAKLVGIFTERDVLVRIVAAGRDPKKTPLAKVMTPDPQTLEPDDSVREALDSMREGHFRHLPVTDGGRLIGIVSIRDLYQSVVDQMGADIILLAEGLLQG